MKLLRGIMQWDREIWAHYFNQDTAQSKVEELLQTSYMQYLHNPNVAPSPPFLKHPADS